ncbi:MAG: hypothetical protein PHF56_09805 [Desulfuromonadaceae bacterium]|nr:hypothetical protein [Desulfuromonadaceae bacterium]
MKKIVVAALMMSTILMLSGCGGGGSSPPPVVVVQPVVTQIPSTLAFDGDILNGITVSPLNSSSVYAGIDPFSPSEYRAFLVFPLTGLGGVPGSAFIDAATLDIFINSIVLHPSASSIPIRIELVSYPPQTLQPSDYYRINLPPLAFTTIIPPISGADVLRHVTLDVTSLMVEAQRRGLANFQIRILEDDGFVFPGLIEIDDTTINRAPLLTVTYF